VLATTRMQRLWNWLGTVPHWIYFTPLRANQPLWRQVILWTSGPTILLGVTGIWIGILRLRSHYRGWKNWHQWSGIAGGVFLLSWIVSGWLSVNPNGWFSGSSPGGEALLRYAGHDGADLPADFDELAHESARTVRFFHIDGMPIAALFATDGAERLVDARTGERVALTDDQLIHAARRLLPHDRLIEHERIEAYDSYWYAHHSHPPLPVLRVAFDDSQHTWFYSDPATGSVLDLLDDGGRRFRWWFNALHRLDFSWLMQNRALWHVTVWVLCLVGLITSVSGTVIGWRRLRRKKSG